MHTDTGMRSPASARSSHGCGQARCCDARRPSPPQLAPRPPPFPRSLRGIEAKQARFGLVECLNHGLLSAYPVTYEKEGELVAHVSGIAAGFELPLAVWTGGGAAPARRRGRWGAWMQGRCITCCSLGTPVHNPAPRLPPPPPPGPAALIKGTVLLMPSGSDRITGVPLQPLQSDKSCEDEEVKALLATRWGAGCPPACACCGARGLHGAGCCPTPPVRPLAGHTDHPPPFAPASPAFPCSPMRSLKNKKKKKKAAKEEAAA